jgi:Tol biopolymer transport system component
MRRLLVAVCLPVLAFAAACSGDYDRYPDTAGSAPTVPPTAPPSTQPPSTTTTTPTTTTTAPPGPTTTTAPGATTTTAPLPPGVPPGRLAIVADDGALLTVRADGSDVTTVTEAPAGGTVVQLAWSPDATRLAFSTTTNRSATLGAGAVDGTPPAVQSITTAPYHLVWNATQTRLAYLRVDSVDTVELGTVDPSMAAAPLGVRSGAPVSASWSRDGGRLLAVVGDQIVLAPADGPGRVLQQRPGPGGAPAWLDERRALVALQDANDRRLVRLDVDTGERQDLLVYDGAISYLPDVTGRYIAYQVVPSDDAGGGGGRVSFPRPGTGTRRAQAGDPPRVDTGVLAVFDTTTGESRVVLDEPAQAFQWSPDGSHLAFLDPQDANASRWRFWTTDPASGGAIVDGPVFVPSNTFTQLVQPYFDQLAPETDWWSPDGTAFTFAGRVLGRDGVWVTSTTAPGAATFVHDGELVAWSPR